MIYASTHLDAVQVRRSAFDLKLLYRQGVTLLGVSREGKRFRERVRKLEIKPGDIVIDVPFVLFWKQCASISLIIIESQNSLGRQLLCWSVQLCPPEHFNVVLSFNSGESLLLLSSAISGRDVISVF